MESEIKLERTKVSEEQFQDLRKLLGSEKFVGFKVVSGSMEPVIKTGEMIVIEKSEVLKRFDIVVFRQNSLLICHFIKFINRTPDSNGDPVYVTSGMANPVREDLPVPLGEILGTVVSHRLGRFFRFRFIVGKILSRRN